MSWRRPAPTVRYADELDADIGEDDLVSDGPHQDGLRQDEPDGERPEGEERRHAREPEPAGGEPSDRPSPARRAGGLSARGRWAASFSLFMLLIGSWSLASPLFSGADETSHSVKAAAVVRGELVGRQVDTVEGVLTLVRVPAMFVKAVAPLPPGTDMSPQLVPPGVGAPGCYIWKPNVPAGCDGPYDQVAGEPLVPTRAGGYPPLYYLLVGLPTLAFPSGTGLYLVRLLSGALCAAFLASALQSAHEWRRSGLDVLGVAVAATPMALHLAGVMTPSGLAISAAICLWASVLGLLAAPGRGHERALARRAGLAASVLVFMHGITPLLLGLALLLMVGAARPASLVTLVKGRFVRRWLLVFAGASTLAAGWMLTSGSTDLGPDMQSDPLTLTEALRTSLGRSTQLVREMIGVFGWLDTPAPSLTHLLWLFVTGLLVVLGLALSPRRVVMALSGLLLLTVLVPVVLEAVQARDHGLLWQGRYTLPLAVGVPILAAFGMGSRLGALGDDLRRRVTTAAAAVLGLAHVAAFAGALQRYTVGRSGKLAFFLSPTWQPPVAAAVLLVAFAGAVAAWGWWLHQLVVPVQTGLAPTTASPTMPSPTMPSPTMPSPTTPGPTTPGPTGPGPTTPQGARRRPLSPPVRSEAPSSNGEPDPRVARGAAHPGL